MNFLFITDSFLPHAGGSRVYYYNVYKRISENGTDRVTVLTKKVAGWREFDSQAASPSFRIIRHFTPLPNYKYRQLPKGFLTFAQSLWLAASKHPDIIHSGDLFPPGLTSFAIKKILGIPYMAYCHGEEVTLSDLRRYQPRVRNQIYRNADGIIAASTFAQSHLTRIGILADRVRQVTPGVDCERYQPRPKNPELVRRYALDGKLVLLTVARLVKRKGHAIVLNALAKIAPTMPNLRYLIVGEGQERSLLEQQCRELGIADQIIFAGHASEELLPDFYNLADIFVMINRESKGDVEGFGMVFLEANAACKPVLGGFSGGTSQAILQGETGFLVNPEIQDEVVSTLTKMLNDPAQCERMGRAGLKRVRREFSWDSRAQAIREFTLDILQSKKGLERGAIKSAAA